MTQVDILAIFAHPDDLELTVGGTMLKMKHLGYRTGALDITAGEMGTRGSAELRGTEAAAGPEIGRTGNTAKHSVAIAVEGHSLQNVIFESPDVGGVHQAGRGIQLHDECVSFAADDRLQRIA